VLAEFRFTRELIAGPPVSALDLLDQGIFKLEIIGKMGIPIDGYSLLDWF
jgi:hypothetical protein